MPNDDKEPAHENETGSPAAGGETEIVQVDAFFTDPVNVTRPLAGTKSFGLAANEEIEVGGAEAVAEAMGTATIPAAIATTAAPPAMR